MELSWVAPFSGSLFALVVDPLLRRLAQGPRSMAEHRFAYADELSLILWGLGAGLLRVLPVSRRWFDVSGPRVSGDRLEHKKVWMHWVAELGM